MVKGKALDLSGYDPDKAKNAFSDKNVQTIAVEIPDDFFHGIATGYWEPSQYPPTPAKPGARPTALPSP
ncbi:hypothetical protein [Streptomyces lycii]|uniref:Uncharacterized protein n=1 Tax=Streptomyces lycii TaxID=2654337 RepID=A0ABQ7FMV2_9ACTN|nr:hypothetical protein [Streptomyces lycii]KAF4408547.1 hypothetical protein GCU69_14060 [Streptomyces lycii]